MQINGSVALVTGANRGLGARLVQALLDAGAAKVYAASRTPGSVAAHVMADRRVATLTLDITDPVSVRTAAEVAGDVTLLVNNAGVLGFGTALDGSLDVFERTCAPTTSERCGSRAPSFRSWNSTRPPRWSTC